MAKRRFIVGLIALWVLGVFFPTTARSAEQPPCAQLGWFPQDFNLKDHHIFIAQDRYYLVSIYFGAAGSENRFAYAVSDDLCNWEDLGFILTERTPGTWDESAIWAPFVLAQDDTYYLFYTGVTRGMAQSIMLAVSTNPADPQAWQPHGMIFQPHHPGSAW